MVQITLVAGDYEFPFGYRGIGLKTWPAVLDGMRRSHAWDTEAGVYRREVPAGVMQVELEVSIGGWGAGAKANLFMDALHAADELQLIIHSMQGGERRLVFQLVEFGGVSWNPSPDAATLVEIPVRGEAAHTYFEGERMVYTTAGSGRVVVPYAGDVESWPTLTLPAGARFKLREEDQWQTAPGGGEWVAYTDPAERRIEVGGQPAPGLVAFWPQPPKRVPGGVEMWIDSKTDVTVEMTERWRKGWA